MKLSKINRLSAICGLSAGLAVSWGVAPLARAEASCLADHLVSSLQSVDLSLLRPRAPISPEAIDWGHEYRLLRYRLRHGAETFRQLTLPARTIENVLAPIHKDSSSTWGIFTVQTAQGVKALKFVAADADFERRGSYPGFSRDQAIVQMHLAELHAMPEATVSFPLQGVFDRQGVHELLARFPWMRDHAAPRLRHQDPRWAILMDYVPDGWNPKPPGMDRSIVIPPPPQAKHWDLDRVLHKALVDGLVVQRLGLVVNDWQNLFTREGMPYLFDTEYVTVAKSPTPPAEPLPLQVSELTGARNPYWQYNELATRLRELKGYLNPFYGYSTLTLRGKEWQALKILRGSESIHPDLRALAEHFFHERTDIPADDERFDSRIRDADPDQRTIYALQFIRENFAAPEYDCFRTEAVSELRRLQDFRQL